MKWNFHLISRISKSSLITINKISFCSKYNNNYEVSKADDFKLDDDQSLTGFLLAMES